MNALITIYVELLNEGTKVLRPVMAIPVAKDLYRIESQNEDPEDEEWQFQTGAVVRCTRRRLSDNEDALVAIEEVKG